MRCALLLGVVVAVGGAGCGNAKQSTAGQTATLRGVASASRPLGVVSGTLAIYGGVLETNRCRCVPEAGTVRFTGAQGQRIDVSVGKTGKFSARIPTGRYTVMAGLNRPMDWRMGSCVALSHTGHDDRGNRLVDIIVGKDRALHVRVACLAG
jgi:hypothetical protein